MCNKNLDMLRHKYKILKEFKGFLIDKMMEHKNFRDYLYQNKMSGFSDYQELDAIKDLVDEIGETIDNTKADLCWEEAEEEEKQREIKKLTNKSGWGSHIFDYHEANEKEVIDIQIKR